MGEQILAVEILRVLERTVVQTHVREREQPNAPSSYWGSGYDVGGKSTRCVGEQID
jgi:hypothetical protein